MRLHRVSPFSLKTALIQRRKQERLQTFHVFSDTLGTCKRKAQTQQKALNVYRTRVQRNQNKIALNDVKTITLKRSDLNLCCQDIYYIITGVFLCFRSFHFKPWNAEMPWENPLLKFLFYLLTCLRSGHSLMIHTGNLRRIKRWKKAPSMHFHTPAPTITQRIVENNLGKICQKDKKTSWKKLIGQSNSATPHLSHDGRGARLAAEVPSVHARLGVIAESCALRPVCAVSVPGTSAIPDPISDPAAVFGGVERDFAAKFRRVRHEHSRHGAERDRSSG